MIPTLVSALAGLSTLLAGALLADAVPREPAPKPPVKVEAKPHAHPHPHPTATTPVQATPVQAPASQFPAGPAGTMEVPETVKDFGSVERGADLKHTFVIKNTGKHPLHIEAKAG